MSSFPPIDLHAHVAQDIDRAELRRLGALVFAATRSLDEAELVLQRGDTWTVWGVGCHPGLVGVQKAFDVNRFADLIKRTPFASEIGLDGQSRVPRPLQRQRLGEILSVLQSTPRIASIHSYSATEEVINELEDHPIQGAVLHWWLGNKSETIRAIDLGCFFSVNTSSIRRREIFELIPPERILSETDHPFGDRYKKGVRRPGIVEDVESAIAMTHGLTSEAVRLLMWKNLASLVRMTATGTQFSSDVKTRLAAV